MSERIVRTLGITAFRTNAYSASAGEQLIESHREDEEEEMYVVVAGHAIFTVAGEENDAPAGTVVLYPEPADHRSAVAIAQDTLAIYDLACHAALAGEHEVALEHWRRALSANPRAPQEWAAGDPSLDSIRDRL